MKIAVVAANGKAGKLIVNELVARGQDVTAIAREEGALSAAQRYVQKDIMDLTTADLEGFNAVVDAFGAWTPETLSQHTTTLMHLADALSGTETRLLVVGGAGSLYVDPQHIMTLSETSEFPSDYKPLATAMLDALTKLRDRKDVKWTYISPAADFQAEGERTGEYLLGGEELITGENGSVISYADYAVAMADEVISGDHIQERISVVRK